MYLGRSALPVLTYVGWVTAMTSGVARHERTVFLVGQSTTPDPLFSTFDWWPFGDFETDLASQPSLTNSPSRLPATTTFFTSSSSHTSASPSPSIVDITALPPTTTNIPHPRIRTKQNLKQFSLVPLFGFGGLLVGVLVGWLVFSSYDKWVARSTAVALVPGPAYVPVNRVNERVNRDRSELVRDVEGSPSKRTKHGTPYSSYSVGRGLLGRIPSSRVYRPPPSATKARTKTNSSETSFAWPSLPTSSRSTPSYSRATTRSSTKSTQTTVAASDDPFTSIGNNSTGSDTKSQTVVVASRRSTFARSSRFGEVWSDAEEDQDAVIVPPFTPTHPAEEGGEVRTGLLKIKSKSVRGKKRDEGPTSGTTELPSPTKETHRKGSWNYSWIPGSPSAKPDSYTVVPARTASPRSQSFRTPESSPRKPSYVGSSEKVRLVDTSILPTSPPTLTSPRLESEFFLTAMAFDIPGTPSPKRTRSLRAATGVRRNEERDDTDTAGVGTISPSLPQLGTFNRSNESRSPTTCDSRPGPGRCLSTASMSTISEFPGDPPPKRTPAERFYARQSALDKVGEIVRRGRSQTGIANVMMSPRRPTLDAVEEDSRRFGRIGKDSGEGGIEQRLFEP